MSSSALLGLRVLLTRPEGDGLDEWAAAFAAVGAVPVLYPTIVATAPSSWDKVDGALAALDKYDWLVFTSQTAVAFVLARMAGQRFPQGLHAKIATVGQKTAQAVIAAGGRVAIVPGENRQEGLVEALAVLPRGMRVLLPIAAGGRTLLADELLARGLAVDVVTVYETRVRSDLALPPPFDVATFASPSALRAFLAGPGKTAIAEKIVAVIGPTTAQEARLRGFHPVVAESPSVENLIHAIANARPAKGEC